MAGGTGSAAASEQHVQGTIKQDMRGFDGKARSTQHPEATKGDTAEGTSGRKDGAQAGQG